MHMNPGVSVEKGGEIPEALKSGFALQCMESSRKVRVLSSGRVRNHWGKHPLRNHGKMFRASAFAQLLAAGKAKYEHLVFHTQRHLCPPTPSVRGFSGIK